MRIVFMGTPDFAVPSLRKLAEDGYNVVSVVTQPDRPKGRKKILTPPPVKETALELQLPIFQPEKIRRPEEFQQVLDWKPDLIVTAAFGQILPKALLEVPRFGCINVHASLLPKYRGGAPIHKAIMDGEKETGVTIMYMVEALDAGDIITQESLPIGLKDTVGVMFEKLSQLGADLLSRTLPDLIAGKIEPKAQDPEKVSFAYTLKREDEKLDFTRSAFELYNQVRGLNPWPVAFTAYGEEILKVWWSEWSDVLHLGAAPPGTVLDVNEEGIYIATGKGILILKELQPAGKKRMLVADYIRGSGDRMKKGQRLGDANG